MTEMVEFLRARYDDDVLVIGHYEHYMAERSAAAGSYVLVTPPGWQPGEPFDPDRQRDEVDAKRRILDEYEKAFDHRRRHPEDLASAGALLEMVSVVKLLALPHAGHPDYRSEWAVAK